MAADIATGLQTGNMAGAGRLPNNMAPSDISVRGNTITVGTTNDAVQRIVRVTPNREAPGTYNVETLGVSGRTGATVESLRVTGSRLSAAEARSRALREGNGAVLGVRRDRERRRANP